MNIYVLNPPFKPNFVRCGRWQGAAARSGGLDYPKWLAYTTAVLEERFENVKLVDAVAENWNENELINDVKHFDPDLTIIDSNFSSLSNDIHIAKLIKENTGSTTVMVGPPTSQFPNRILEAGGVDIVARFEYDFTIREIAEALDNAQKVHTIKGISYKENGKIIHNENRKFTSSDDLDKIPFVSKIYKKHLDIKKYFLSQSLYPEIQIFTGRGCPNRCTFCSWPETLMGRVYRSRSAKNIVDEFEWVQKNLPEVKEIFIEDDTFTINKKLVRSVCNEMNHRGIDITWSCNARADLDYETMKQMKKAGCRLIIVGYESGNDHILKNIKKGITTTEMRNFTRQAKKAGLLIHGDFIIGLPGETKSTIKDTADFINQIKPNMLQIAIASPIPGTDFYNFVSKNGYLLEKNIENSINEEGFQECIIEYPDLSYDDITKSVDEILRGYYLNISFIPVAIENCIVGRGFDEIRIMLRSGKDFLKYATRRK